MVKKVITAVVWSVLGISLLVLWGFAGNTHKKLLCRKVNIEIDTRDENFFVEEKDIIELAREKGHILYGEDAGSLDVYELEKAVNNHPSVQRAEVFQAISGDVTVRVTQRRPIVRVINWKGESFYIDDKGKLMPLSKNFTARVPVATGNIFENYAAFYPYDLDDINDSVLKKTSLSGIYHLAKYVDTSEFWKAQIEQINIGDDIELIPKVGNHVIVFGDTSDVHEKFNKLKIFYREGLNKIGWNKYSVINLNFRNQVVCKK